MKPIDVIQLAQDLIRLPSVTPQADGVIDYLEQLLKSMGFDCQVMTFESPGCPPVRNLFARFGTASPHLCFAGHVDVVPVGNLDDWQYPPFAATLENGHIYGRGAVDMKGAIAAFIASVSQSTLDGSISLLITGDEEGDAIDGTIKVLEELKKTNNLPDVCLVGEPTSETWVGDTIKIGRRGSLSGQLSIQGRQGHVAYPSRADNPIPRLTQFLNQLQDIKWDEGTAEFDPSNLEVTSICADNIAGNVIPGRATANFNIRYNNLHSRQDLIDQITRLANNFAGSELTFSGTAEPFMGSNSAWPRLIAESVLAATGQSPKKSTTGGTSDARFIHKYCPVAELGLLNHTAHQVDEYVAVADLLQLQAIYAEVLVRYFQCLPDELTKKPGL